MRQRQLIFPILAVLFTVMFIPWLGETLFNTKGEPREAIVAYSMINSGNWILPESFGSDIPYKPPFFAWCIATVAEITGCMNEFVSRLPSALSTIILALCTFKFFVSNRVLSPMHGAWVATIFITSTEVFRATSACRVDMLLTLFIVGALFSLYRYFIRPHHGLPWGAIVLMTCAVLTKGPVGMVLPCLCAGIFALAIKKPFWPTFLKLAASGIISLIIPALWYWAAYRQGGDEFYALAMEENFGRLTGSMSYASHENPISYNFLTVATGMLPYTLIALMSLFAIRYRWTKPKIRNIYENIINLDPTTLYSIICTVVIFVFYCIPKSKRSVYLLPIYPFLAYFVTLLIIRLCNKAPKTINIYCSIIPTVSLLTAAAFIAAGLGLGDTIALKGSTHAMIDGIRHSFFTPVGIIAAILLTVAGIVPFMLRRKLSPARKIGTTLCVTCAIYLALNMSLLPAILNTKSDRNIAESIEKLQPTGNIYQFVDDPMLRYYTTNFYLGDRLRLFDDTTDENGLLLTNEKDLKTWESNYGNIFRFNVIYHDTKKSCDTKSPAVIVKFSRKQAD